MKKLCILMSVFSLVATGLNARLINVGTAPTGVRLTGDSLLQRAGRGMTFEISVAALSANEIKVKEGTFTRLSIPGFQHSEEIGAPALPVMNQLIEIPLGGNVEVKVLDKSVKQYSFEDLGLKAPIAPRQPPHPKSLTKAPPFVYEKSAYVVDGWRHDELAEIEDLGLMRHMRLALLKIAPVSYNPVAQKLEVINNIRVKVSVSNPDMRATAELKKKYASPAFGFAYKNVTSPASLRFLNRRSEDNPIHYLIVADRMFEADLAPFIQWKTEKGFKVTTAYTDEIGAGTDEIKAYIKSVYEGDDAPDFLLFVGDNEQIPAFSGQTNYHITDLYYVAVTEGDNLPDILWGRFSAQNSEQLIPQIRKTLEYEKYAFADPGFLQRMVLIAGWDYSHATEWGWPQIKYGLENYFNEDHGFTTLHTYLTTGGGQHESDILENISAGCCYVNYTAHGSPTSWADPSMSIDDINAYNNKGMYPLVVGNCCLTNRFQVGTCFGEAWLRAPEKGAIGYIGGTNSTYWDEDLWWGCGYYTIAHPNDDGAAPSKEDTGQGAYDGVFEGNWPTTAGMVMAGNLAVEESNSSRKLYYWEVYMLMGDPSLSVYWGIPSDNTVEFPETISSQGGLFEVRAAAGSYVSITVNGQLMGASFVVEDGKAAFNLSSLPQGKGKVVVTGQNLKPFIGEFTVE